LVLGIPGDLVNSVYGGVFQCGKEWYGGTVVRRASRAGLLRELDRMYLIIQVLKSRSQTHLHIALAGKSWFDAPEDFAGPKTVA
jgi:hypothetical protein